MNSPGDGFTALEANRGVRGNWLFWLKRWRDRLKEERERGGGGETEMR